MPRRHRESREGIDGRADPFVEAEIELWDRATGLHSVTHDRRAPPKGCHNVTKASRCIVVPFVHPRDVFRAFPIGPLARRPAGVTARRARDDKSDFEKHSSDRARTTWTLRRDSATQHDCSTPKQSLTMTARNPTITARRPIAPREAVRPMRGAAIRIRFLPLPRA
ncbi:MAG: hypothetical protein ABI442_21100 [Gemmatimonadaceae bacterium]